MQKLHLVGFTTDQKGLILSAGRGARSGSLHLAADVPAEAVEPPPPRVESALPVRQIQARLPQGRTVTEVAEAAGVEVTWDEDAARWTTRQLADGRCVVRYRYRYRGKDRALRFEESAESEVTAGEYPSGQPGYVAPDRPPPARSAPPPPSAPAADRPAAKRATFTTGVRPDAAKPTSPAAEERERATVAMGKAARPVDRPRRTRPLRAT